MDGYRVHIQDFDGPLDLLLHLIEKAEVNIEDIFVSEITAEYLEYMQELTEDELDAASDFLTVAAQLVYLKSRHLLPRPAPLEEGEEEDPEKALIRQLEEYQQLKTLASEMQQFEKAAAAMYEKLPEEFPLPPPTFELEGLTLEGLTAAFARVLARMKETEETVPVQRGIIRDAFSVPRCMSNILRRLRKGPVVFDRLFSDEPSRDEVISTFLALLELLKAGRARAVQDSTYGEITIHPHTPDPEEMNEEDTTDHGD